MSPMFDQGYKYHPTTARVLHMNAPSRGCTLGHGSARVQV